MLRPRVLLLDEPLGALDAKLRKQLQLELRAVQREVGITFVYVTHDQEEALTMSDQIAVLAEGRIEQVGPPQEIYSAPATTFVAGFLGAANIFDAEVLEAANGSAVCSALDTRLGAAVDDEVARARRPSSSGRSASPLQGPDEPVGQGHNAIAGMVSQVVYLGHCTQVHVDVGAPTSADRRGAQPSGPTSVSHQPGERRHLRLHPRRGAGAAPQHGAGDLRSGRRRPRRAQPSSLTGFRRSSSATAGRSSRSANRIAMS